MVAPSATADMASPAPLLGDLADFPIGAVLRFIDAGGRPGRLEVEGPLPATFELCHSTLDTAGGGDRPLVETLFHLALVGGGAFTFTPDDHVDAAGGKPLGDVLDEVGGRVERWRELSAVLPSLDVVICLRPTDPASAPVQAFELSARSWDVVVAVDGIRSVRDITLQVGGDAFTTMEVVHDLVRRGLAAVVPAGTSV